MATKVICGGHFYLLDAELFFHLGTAM